MWSERENFDMPKISFIVPVYKMEKYIHQCVQSILKQTFKDFELILVDDGSPDTCPEICDEYAAKDNRVKVIHKKNAGVSAARNSGIELAQGEWAYFVDSDDWIQENAAEILYNDAVKTGADCVMSDCVVCYDNGKKVRLHQFSKAFYTEKRKDIESIQKYILCHKFSPHYHPNTNNGYAAPWGKFVKMSIIKDNNIQFDPYAKGIFDDGVYSLYLLEHVNKFYYNDQHTYNYRVVGSSLTHSFKKNVMEVMECNYKLVDEFIAACHDNDESYKQAEYCRRVASFASYLSKYYYNPNNTMSNKEITQSIKNALDSEPYKTAFAKADKKNLETKHAFILFCVRFRLISGLKLYAKLKRMFKRS